MKKSPSKETEQYWSNRYTDNATGWDLGACSPPLKAYIDQLTNKNLKILIPGAGNGYEAEYLYQQGFKNTFIMDISELPLLNFKKRVPNFPPDQLLHKDFFEYTAQFDLIIEQTFFCSFPPVDNNRENYTKKMYELLKPNGKLVGLWFNIPLTGDLIKRPFGSTKKEYISLFKSHFDLAVFEDAYNSIEPRMGRELFGILQKK